MATRIFVLRMSLLWMTFTCVRVCFVVITMEDVRLHLCLTWCICYTKWSRVCVYLSVSMMEDIHLHLILHGVTFMGNGHLRLCLTW